MDEVRELLAKAQDAPAQPDALTRLAIAAEGIRYELAALVSIQRRQTSIHRTLIQSLIEEYDLARDDDDE